LSELTEKKPGIFYFRASAFLHFHEDPTGLYADVKLDFKSFERIKLARRADELLLLKRVKQALAEGQAAKASRKPSA
jgi:hypothetical protein